METQIFFNAYSFKRYPKSPRKSDQRYFKGWCVINGIKKKRYLHRYKWEIAFGEIPKGYHIHHIDKDFFNNELCNYACITAKEHLSNHYKEKSIAFKLACTDRLKANSHLSAAWHKTEAGINQKKANYKYLLLPNPIKLFCLNCNIQFETIRRDQKYCSNKCKCRKVARDKYHRDKSTGKYIPLKNRKSLITKS